MSKTIFNIEMLPARHGDCLWIEYGNLGGKTNRILIDGGPVSTFEFIKKRIDEMPEGDKVFELVVLTHVDADHIEGLVRMFADKPLPFKVKHVWFNGWRQLKKTHGLLGALEGEFLSALLVHRVPHAWNPDNTPWVIKNNENLPNYPLADDMKLTLLSPNIQGLDKMAKAWEKTIKKKGFNPGDLEAALKALASKKKFIPMEGLLGTTPNLDELLSSQFLKDDAVPNGSSIAFLAEFDEKKVLLLGDAHPDIIYDSLKSLCKERGVNQLEVDAVKIAHHGSKKNTSQDMLKLIHSPIYLISTNGDQFKHPDPECIALILEYGKPKKLYFNYISDYTKSWLDEKSQKKYRYKAIGRESTAPLLRIKL